MKKLLLLITVICSYIAHAQKTIHDPYIEVRKVTGFSAIEISGGIDLYLSQGDEAVAVSAKDEKVRSRIKTEVVDGTLKIYSEWKEGLRIGRNDPIKAYVSFKTLKALRASGGSDVNVQGVIESVSLDLHVSGGSDFRGKVDVESMNIQQSGGSDVDISGSVTTLNIQASGGSDLDGYELVSDHCTVEANGGSDVTITANKSITADASGGSDINWKGTASVQKSNTSGAGSVSHRS